MSSARTENTEVRAAVYDRYGPPDVLRIEEVPEPAPGAGQVRVEVVATSVNLSDWECLRGSPLYARLGGLRVPARRTLGSGVGGGGGGGRAGGAPLPMGGG